MLNKKTSKQGAPSTPQAKTKKATGEIQTIKNNLSRTANRLDASDGEELPEEEAKLQEDGEETEGDFHQ